MPITDEANDHLDDGIVDPSIPDLDQSLYIIVDTSNILYHERIRPFSNDLDKEGGFFIPRLNKEGTKCLVQLKVNKDAYPWLNAIGPAVIGKGDKYWAAEQMKAATGEWEGAYNEWHIHRDFLTGEIDKTLYETLLEEGRNALVTAVKKTV